MSQKGILKSLLIDISVYSVGDILSKGIGFFAVILFSYFLSHQEMGAYGYITVILGFSMTFLVLGFDNALTRYFFEKKTLTERKKLISTLFAFVGFWSLLLLSVFLLGRKIFLNMLFQQMHFQMAMIWAIFSLPLKIFSILSNQILRNTFQKKRFVKYNLITSIVFISTALGLLIYTSLGLISIFIAFIISDLVVLPFRIYEIRGFFIWEFDRLMLKQLLSYGIPFLPVSIAYWIFSGADRFMLEHLRDLETVGNYTIAVTLSGVMTVISSGIGNAWSPIAVKAYEEDHNAAKNLYQRFFKILMATPLIIIFPTALFGKELIEIFLHQQYHSIFYPFLILLTGISFKLTTQVTASGISLKKKTKYFSYITFGVAILNIGINYLLIPTLGEIGAALATLISYVVLTFVYGWVSQRLFAINYDTKTIIYALLILFSCFLASLLPINLKALVFLGVGTVLYTKKNSVLNQFR